MRGTRSCDCYGRIHMCSIAPSGSPLRPWRNARSQSLQRGPLLRPNRPRPWVANAAHSTLAPSPIVVESAFSAPICLYKTKNGGGCGTQGVVAITPIGATFFDQSAQFGRNRQRHCVEPMLGFAMVQGLDDIRTEAVATTARQGATGLKNHVAIQARNFRTRGNIKRSARSA